MNYILREIKLSKLSGIPMSKEASKLSKFWDDLWCDMKVRINTIEGEIECWKDGHGRYYFRQYNKLGALWCDYEKVWSFFQGGLCLGCSEIQELIQHMVTEALSCEVNTPLSEERKYRFG